MAQEVYKQFHPAFQPPTEAVVGPFVLGTFGPRPVTNGGPSFRMGRLRIEVPGLLGAVVDRAVDYGYRLSKFRESQGIQNGGIQAVSSLPVFFHKPDRMETVDADLGANKVLKLHYTDYAHKHPDLAGPYEVTVTLEYIARIPEVEALDDANIRRRIYEDLYVSGVNHLEIDPQDYKRDPDYSAASDTARRLEREQVMGKPGYLEEQLTKQ